MKKSLLIIGILFFTKIWAQEATFEPLGFITDSPNAFSQAEAVSTDGSVVVGVSYSIHEGAAVLQAFRWENGIMTGIGMLPTTEIPWSYARGVSADGSTIVGYSFSDNSWDLGWEAMRWTQDGGMEALGDFLESDYWSESTDVSADGSIVVGRSFLTGQGFRWENGIMESLSTDDVQFLEAWGISDDGSVIIGNAVMDGAQQGAVWREGEGIIGLGSPSTALNVSADGTFVVGNIYISGVSDNAFRWSEEEGMVELGTLGGFGSQALAVSNDGSVVVGFSQTSEGNDFHAFIWTQENGMEKLQEVLEDSYGLDLSGWTLTVANAISADGKTIVGYGINPDGKTEAWRVVLISSSGGCVTPDTLSTGIITGTTAEFSWSPVTGETNGYNWYVMNMGESPETGTPVDSGTTEPGVTSATATGLTPNTMYFVYLQTNCDEDTQSGYGGPFMLITTGEMGTIDNEINSISLYPNPTTGIVNIHTTEKINSISVYNAAGQKVSFNSLNKENTSIDISNLSGGVYFVEIIINDKTTKRYKVIRK